MTDALDTLLPKLDGWLRQQPEWADLFLADRKARRRASDAIARRIYMLPKVDHAMPVKVVSTKQGPGNKLWTPEHEVHMNRATRRKAGVPPQRLTGPGSVEQE